VEEVDMAVGVPHSFAIAIDLDGPDVWVGTAKGLAHGVGDGYYPGLKARPPHASPAAAPVGGRP
jgi:hypothetical protein